MSAPSPIADSRIWDLPTRLFHWVLTLLIAMQYATAKFGVLDMTWHMRGGCAILVLVIFRVVWGIAGSETSRFAAFVRRPSIVWRYVSTQLSGARQTSVGHNPLGGWSVIALLLSVAVQALSGLFASDDLETEGPLAAHVSRRTIKLMSQVHSLNQNILLLLIALHVLAVLLYLLVGKENLILPMITGNKRLRAPPLRFAKGWLAVCVFVVAATVVTVFLAWAGE